MLCCDMQPLLALNNTKSIKKESKLDRSPDDEEKRINFSDEFCLVNLNFTSEYN